jgi:CHRD domain
LRYGSEMRRIRPRVILALLVGAAVSLSACSSSTANTHALVLKARLTALPAGTVSFGTDPTTHRIVATLDVYGLTLRSVHGAFLAEGTCAAPGAPIVSLPDLTADAYGVIKTQSTGTNTNALPAVAHFEITATGSSASGGTTPIACGDISTSTLTAAVHGQGGSTASGTLTMSYESGSLTIRLVATGLPPSTTHAFHIHFGSCEQQSGVLFNVGDVIADGAGTARYTTTLQGLKTAPPSTQWYADLHTGASSALEVGGNPSPAFQPLLCGDGGAVTSKS